MNRNSFATLLAVLAIVVLAHFLLNSLFPPSVRRPLGERPKDESAYARVMRTGVIRSAWLEYPPYFVKNANTGEFSGVFYEITNEVAKRLNLTVDWTEEVGYGTMLEGLRTKRYEIVGCGIWPNASRAREANFSRSVFFSPVCAYVRPGDTRFDEDLAKVDDPSVTIATIDGEMSDLITSADFPGAERLSLPQMSHVSQNLLNVASGKADMTFCEPHMVEKFLLANPNSLRNITTDRPVRIFANALVLPRDEMSLKTMIDVTLAELLNSGFIERVLRKYEEFPGTYYRVARPFDAPGSGGGG